MEYRINKKETDVWGLKYFPDMIDYSNDLDNIPDIHREVLRHLVLEFSECNKNTLIECLKEKPKTILEIGVHRNPLEVSTTGTIFEHKENDCIYIGIDLNDKSYLNDSEKNIHTIIGNSSNHELVYDFMDKLSIKEFDLIIIDGFHSVNQVVDDWKYVEKLSNNGIVFFHDTNTHPGPVLVFDAIDESIFNKEKRCQTIDDWGVAFAKKI